MSILWGVVRPGSAELRALWFCQIIRDALWQAPKPTPMFVSTLALAAMCYPIYGFYQVRLMNRINLVALDIQGCIKVSGLKF